MVDPIDDPDGGHRAPCNGQDVHAELVEGHIIFGVHDVDGLQFSVYFQGGRHAPSVGIPRTQRISVLLLVFLLNVGAVVHVDGNYFKMVVEVKPLLF